jgi:hypothetical protein
MNGLDRLKKGLKFKNVVATNTVLVKFTYVEGWAVWHGLAQPLRPRLRRPQRDQALLSPENVSSDPSTLQTKERA